MVKIVCFLVLTFLFHGVCSAFGVTPLSVGEKCGKTVSRHDGTTVQVVFLQCPEAADRNDALFCCGNETHHHCCTAEELMTQRKKGNVKFDESAAALEIFGDEPKNDTHLLGLNDAVVEHTQPKESEICEDNHSPVTFLILCPASGESHNNTRCCKSVMDNRRYCCTEYEYQHNKWEIREFEDQERKKDAVVKFLGAFLLLFFFSVLVAWYLCVYRTRLREYKFIGVSDPLLGDRTHHVASYTVFLNADDKESTERLKKLGLA